MRRYDRLFKDSSTQMICGVCSGLAQYFDVDVSIVRLLVAFLSLGWGSGLLLYILAAIILPEKRDIYPY